MLTAPRPSDEFEADRKLLHDLWQRLLPQTAARLSLLDQAALAAANHVLTPRLQEDAAATAHKFAGSLGMFGFNEGTRLALRLEEHLGLPAPDPSALAILTGQLRRSLPELGASSCTHSPDLTE